MLRPETENALAAMVRDATGPLRIKGGGTRSLGGVVSGEVLKTGDLTGIALYEPGALTIVVKAGTPLAEVEAALVAENQRLAFEPMDHRGLLGTSGEPTIGGVVAANVSGPRRVQIGACRDYLLGVRFVDGAGTIVKNGGRVMKNVTGYDLVKLMCGSWGTLGVLTEVSLKVLPNVETQSTLVFHGLSPAQAVEAMSAALGSPFEVSGAAHHSGMGTMLRLEGFATSVAYRIGRLKDRLQAFGQVTVVEAGDSEQLWADVRDVAPLHGAAGDIWRMSVRPSAAPAVVAALATDAVLLDWGGGLIWAALPAGTDGRRALAGIDGHATLIRAEDDAVSSVPVFQPEPPAVAALSAGLRAKFDPRGILNPGLMATDHPVTA